MRVIDRLRAGLVGQSPSTQLPDWSPSYDDFIASLKADLVGRPVIVIDNVAQFTLGDGGREKWNISDFPNAAPPWTTAWFEYRVPQEIRTAVGVEAVSMWVDTTSRDEGGWTLFCWPFAQPNNRRDIVGPIGGMTVEVAADGSVEQFSSGATHVGESGSNEALIFVIPVLMAISFAHCRNVSEEQIKPPERLSANHKRKFGAPLTRYTVLKIDPMRETLRVEGGSDAVGIPKALHICRGHFKTYDERPLFGRHKGTYFWPEHVKGSAARGQVNKDYMVLTPQPDGSLVQSASTARYPSATHAQEIESFSMARAVDLASIRWPDAEIRRESHSNPGYDIAVVEGGAVVHYVEVKGTTADAPGFFMSETERRFSVDHDDQYSLLVVGEINLGAETFVSQWFDGRVDRLFSLEPTQWRGTVLDA